MLIKVMNGEAVMHMKLNKEEKGGGVVPMVAVVVFLYFCAVLEPSFDVNRCYW